MGRGDVYRDAKGPLLPVYPFQVRTSALNNQIFPYGDSFFGALASPAPLLKLPPRGILHFWFPLIVPKGNHVATQEAGNMVIL